MVRGLERHGVVVARVITDRHDVDTFSQFSDRPIVVLGADKAAPRAARPVETVPDLGPGQRDGPTRPVHHRRRRARLLL
jgi:hypothetical protein